MLFWIFVIIGVIALGITVWAACWEAKDEKKYKRLKDEHEHLERMSIYVTYHSDPKIWDMHRKAESEAYQRLKDFEKEHPNIKDKSANREKIGTIATGVLIGAAVVVIIMLMALMIIHIDAPAEFARKQAEYEALSWEVSNDIYAADDDVLGRKELYNQVREWNKSVAGCKAKANDFWIGIFVPDYYNNLQLIELK